MKIISTIAFMLLTFNAWSHCGGCAGDAKTSHSHSEEEMAKEKAACKKKMKLGKYLSAEEVKMCKKYEGNEDKKSDS